MGDNPVSIIPGGIDAREVKNNFCNKHTYYIVVYSFLFCCQRE